MTATVAIKTGEHQNINPTPPPRFFEEQLERRGIHGDFTVIWGPRYKGTPHTPRFKAMGIRAEHRTVELIAKPGDNGSATVCWITPDRGTEFPLPRLMDMLSASPVMPGGKAPVALTVSNTKQMNDVLTVVASHGEEATDIVKLKSDLNMVFGEHSSRSWGAIFRAMGAKKLVKLRINAAGIIGVRVTDAGYARIRTAAPVRTLMDKAPVLPPLDVSSLPSPRQIPQQMRTLVDDLTRRETELARSVSLTEEMVLKAKQKLQEAEAALNTQKRDHEMARSLLNAARLLSEHHNGF